MVCDMGALVDRAKSMPRWGLAHPWTHAAYQVGKCTHIFLGGESIEEFAEGLAEAVGRCNEDAHEGHGQTHSAEEQECAYKAAIDQLLTRDYWQEYLELQRAIEHYELWNGNNPNPMPVPRMVFQPNPENPRRWQLFLTHPETGLPAIYDISEKLLDLPPPDPKEYYHGQLGYYRKKATARERLAQGLRSG